MTVTISKKTSQARETAKKTYEQRDKSTEAYRNTAVTYLNLLAKANIVHEGADRTRLAEMIKTGEPMQIWKALNAIWINNTATIPTERKAMFLTSLKAADEATGPYMQVQMMSHYVSSVELSTFSTKTNNTNIEQARPHFLALFKMAKEVSSETMQKEEWWFMNHFILLYLKELYLEQAASPQQNASAPPVHPMAAPQ